MRESYDITLVRPSSWVLRGLPARECIGQTRDDRFGNCPIHGPLRDSNNELLIVGATPTRTLRAGRACTVIRTALAGEVPRLSGFVVGKDILGNQDAVYFVRPVRQTERSSAEVHLGQR